MLYLFSGKKYYFCAVGEKGAVLTPLDFLDY